MTVMSEYFVLCLMQRAINSKYTKSLTKFTIKLESAVYMLTVPSSEQEAKTSLSIGDQDTWLTCEWCF
jgi:hypothetical protein